MHTVLRRTLNSALGTNTITYDLITLFIIIALSGGAKPTAAQIELRLVSSKGDIERPSLVNGTSRT